MLLTALRKLRNRNLFIYHLLILVINLTKYINFTTEIRTMIDEKDVKIIEILQKNSRTPFLTISKKLNVSESTIRKRVKKLENNEIIKKYTITINPKKLGYHSVSLLGLDVSPNNYLEAANKLSKFPEIKSLATTTGDHMIMTEIWSKDGI